MHKKTKTITLRAKIMRTLIATAIVQLIIIGSVISVMKTTTQLNVSTKQSLINSVSTQGAALENMLVRCSSLSDAIEQMRQITAAFCAVKGDSVYEVMNSDNSVQLLKRYEPMILRMLHTSGTTGSFVILEGEEGSNAKDCLYLRDTTPLTYAENDSDILAESGPGEFIVQSGYTLDYNWSTKLEISNKSDFYYKPYIAARQYKGKIDSHNLGYWSSTFRLRPNDMEIITYTVPMTDADGNVFGVMGVEISLDYLKTLLNNREIIVDENAGFVLATSHKEGDYFSQVTTGAQYQAQLPSGTFFQMIPDKDALYQIEIPNIEETNLASSYSMHLYNTNTPFEQEQWCVVGIAHQQVIEHAANTFLIRLCATAVLALFVNIIAAVIVSYFTTKPVNNLMHGIESITDENIRLPITNIEEFDNLGKEIEKRSKVLRETAYKIANIIEMTDLQLGVFEYDAKQTRNFCTEKILKILEINKENSTWDNNYVDFEEMQRVIPAVKAGIILEAEETEIYYFNTAKGDTRWIRVRKVGSEEHYLCVVLDVTNDIKEKKKIRYERDYDVLTDLYNRRAFQREVTNILEKYPDTKGIMSIWDLDNLKFMNDTYGHDMGDRYINLLASVFKRIDKSNVIMARMSGDEFMLFIYDENVIRISEMMRDVHKAFLAEKWVLPDNSELSVSVSAGMAIYPYDGNNYKELLKYADFAMYEVKNREKGAIKLFSRDTYVRDYLLVQGVGELNRILLEESIHYVFQPIIDVHTRQVFAYEALLRPDSTLLKGPDELIRLAESQSKLGQIEALTWFHSLKEFERQTVGKPEVKLFINSIPNQCLKEEEFDRMIALYGPILSHVVMEITEIAKADEQQEKIKYEWCKKHNIQIALDDYGSGYSNNDILLARHFDYVKIDMTIIRDIHMLPAKKKLVKSIIEYCHEKGIKVITEGVELKQELEEVITLGADYVQGFYLARPDAKMQYK